MRNQQWAEDALAKLQAGEPAVVNPRGHSMHGRIRDGETVTIEPCSARDLVPGDIVLARIRGRRYYHLVLHLIIAREDGNFVVGNNHGRIDGWVSGESIYGKVSSEQSDQA